MNRLITLSCFVVALFFTRSVLADENADAGSASVGADAASAIAPDATAAPASGPHAEPQASADGGAPAADGGAEEDDLSMKITGSTRPSDMAAFAEESAHETKVGAMKARYALNFFGDVGGGVIGSTRRDVTPTFGVGGFSFLFTGQLENSIKATAEVLIEYSDNAPVVDLERLHLRYTHKSGLWIEAGRTHVDLGYWNVAFHHGKWLQPTIERPRAVRFEDEGGILPIHWIGLGAGYTVKLGGSGALDFALAVGNGRGKNPDDIQNAVDTHAGKQGMGKIELRGVGLRDLRVGVSGVYGHISRQPVADRPALPDVGLTEYIGNVYVAYPSFPFMAFAEAYYVSHGGPTRSWETYDAFVVLGYAFPPVTPYVRLERIVMTNGLDPFYIPDPLGVSSGGIPPALPEVDVYDATLGARFDVSSWSAVKTEYRLERLVDYEELLHTGYASWQFAL